MTTATTLAAFSHSICAFDLLLIVHWCWYLPPLLPPSFSCSSHSQQIGLFLTSLSSSKHTVGKL